MAISGVNPKCYILALFVRDDGARFLLGDDPFEFKDNQLHFQQNTMANDVVEVQGNDGYLLAGQVRRPGTQMFDGYVCNGTNSKEEVEVKRRAFLQFFRRSHFYKVIYVFPNGTAIQRKQGFLVDDPTVQELYQQYPAYHVALNFEDVNYYTYEEDDQGHEIYAKEAIVPLARGGATGGLIWDNYGVVWEDAWSLPLSISGVQFQILNNAGVRAPIDNVKLYGDNYQQTYSGKNLFPLGTGTYTNHGFTSVYNADGSITVSGTAEITYANITTNRVVNYEQGKTYTLSIKEVLPCSVGAILSGSGTKREDINVIAGSTSGKRTLNQTHTTAALYIFNLTVGQSYSFTIYPMVEEGSTASPFEPYVGGIPAPNPDYPQDIDVVTGEQNVWVHMKNLCKSLGNTKTQSGVTMTKNADGTYTAIGTPTGSAYILPQTQQQSDTFPAGTYTFSLSSNQVSRYVVEWYSLSDLSTRIGVFDSRYSSDAHAPHTLTTTEPLRFRISLVFADRAGEAINYTCGFQIEAGSTATTYEPYQSQTYTVDLGATELCKIGDYQDKIFNNDPNEDWYNPDLEDNAWYVHKETGKVVLDGTESWSNGGNWWGSGRANYGMYCYFTDLAKIGVETTYNHALLCNDFSEPETGLSLRSGVNEGIKQNGGTGQQYIALAVAQTRLADVTSQALTLSSLKNWLSTNKPIVYHTLDTSTDTKITDATLVGQLEALGAMKLFIGENNVLVSTPTPNLPATLAFDYYTKFAAIGAEWEEGGTKGATIVNVDAIDNTYPVWQLTGPATNPTLSVLTTNTALTYNGTITASQKLVIDMFNKTATLNGTSVIGNISGDFVYMAPGTNRLAYTAGNAEAPDSTIYWQEVVG